MCGILTMLRAIVGFKEIEQEQFQHLPTHSNCIAQWRHGSGSTQVLPPTAVGQHGKNTHVRAGWGPRFRLQHLCVSTGIVCCACASTMRAWMSADVCWAIQTRTLALHPTCICGLRLCSRGCLCIGAACVLCGGWVLGAARLWPCAVPVDAVTCCAVLRLRRPTARATGSAQSATCHMHTHRDAAWLVFGVPARLN